jgi:flagellar basal body rod protein FlgB
MVIPSPVRSPEVYEPETGLNDTGLNNVDIDREMTDLAENHLFFNAGARLLAGTFNGLKKSISGRATG